MLNKRVISDLMGIIKEKGRMLDYELLANFFDFRELDIIAELKRYQNSDGGFGNALEPDVRMPDSNIVSTNIAVHIIEAVDDESLRGNIERDIALYYEKTYIEDKEIWEMVPKEVNNYPRAIWWNYDENSVSSYGNPNPQIVGFLYKHRNYLKKIDIDYHVKKVVNYILNDFPKESAKHNILSCLFFYSYMTDDIKEKIYETIQIAVDKELKLYHEDTYCLEPYEIKLAAPVFIKHHKELLEKNLDLLNEKIHKGLVLPNWKWNQFPEEFEKAKDEWASYLTYRTIKALLIN